jgi:hypothetical protein
MTETNDYWIIEDQFIFKSYFDFYIQNIIKLINYLQMIETNDYWIIEDQFIFKPQFDLPIDVYKNKISQYNKLVFSNYTDAHICIKTNNKYYYEYYNKYLLSKFNQKVDLPPNLVHINFGYFFNQKVDLPPNLVYINFGEYFNQKVDLPLNLVYINFGEYFNQKVDLPPNLIYLTFGHKFNQKVDLPLNIKYLKIDCNNKNLIDYLPDSIEELILDSNFDLELNDLPQSIKKIIFNSYTYIHELNCLPSNIEYIQLPQFYNKEIIKYPNKLKTIKCSNNYKYVDLLKEKGYEVLTFLKN